MAVLIDEVKLGPTQRVELYEDGTVWIIDSPGKGQEVELTPAASTQLFDFLNLHMRLLHKLALNATVDP